jgi:hypothetical protein
MDDCRPYYDRKVDDSMSPTATPAFAHAAFSVMEKGQPPAEYPCDGLARVPIFRRSAMANEA